MNQRPLSVTILSLLMIAAGAFGLIHHFKELTLQHLFQHDTPWVCLLRLLAIVFGAFMLRGSDWARWLTLGWLAFHVVLSMFHSVGEVAAHATLLAVFAFFLFRPRATQYFRRTTKEAG